MENMTNLDKLGEILDNLRLQPVIKEITPSIKEILQQRLYTEEQIKKTIPEELINEVSRIQVNPTTTIKYLLSRYQVDISNEEQQRLYDEITITLDNITETKSVNDWIIYSNSLLDEITQPTQSLRNYLCNESDFNKRSVRVEIAQLINEIYDIFQVDITPITQKKQVTKYYLYKQDGNYYEINRTWLKNELKKIAGRDLYINLDEVEQILNFTPTVKEFDDEYVELKNIYIHKPTMEIIPKNDDKAKNILTKDRLGFIDKKEIRLFNYTPEITIDTIKPEEKTKTYKILEQILIPKHAQYQKSNLKFYMQLLGMMVHGENDIKILPYFTKRGSNGKTRLVRLCTYLFPNGFINIESRNLKDNFLNESLNTATHCIINDELDIDDIKKYQNTYKNLSGGNSMGGRAMYSSEQLTVDKIAPVILSGNYIPNIDLSDENEAILERLIIVDMPNKFVGTNEYDPNQNHYLRRDNINNILRTDYDGLSQVLSIAINEYKKLDYDGVIREQLGLNPSLSHTLEILTKSHPLLAYLKFCLKEIPNESTYTDRITTADIKDEYIKWYRKNNKDLDPPEKSIDPLTIGKAIKQIYPNIQTKKDGVKYYPLRFKNEDTQTKENYQRLMANPATENTRPKGDLQNNIYSSIVTGSTTNTHEIIEEFKHQYGETDIREAIKDLNERGLIEFSDQSTLQTI